MLKWKKLREDFIAVNVGKKYNKEPYYWTTFYYYKGIIIDTGCPHTADESAKFLEEMELNVKAILLTHYHEDHSGGAHLFKSEFNVEVFAPEKAVGILANPPEIPTYRQIVWGQPKPVKAIPIKNNMNIGNLTITTIDTPGHSFDHISILIGRELFIGDLVTNINPIIALKEENWINTINSIIKILKFEFDNAYGGHGIWHKNEVEKALKNTLELKREMETLWRKGLSVNQIVEQIFPNPPKKVLQMEEVSGGEWSRKNLVESLLGLKVDSNRF
jgi:glyoxylase-like metal-dependent hydrolase (beta-lactamase superfamily II)